MREGSKKSALGISLLLVVVLLIAGSVAYFYFSKPSDNTIKAAVEQLTLLKNEVESIDEKTGSISKVKDVNKQNVEELESLLGKFRKAQSALVEDERVIPGALVKDVMGYSKSLESEIASMKSYMEIFDECYVMAGKFNTAKGMLDFESVSEDCRAAVATAKSSAQSGTYLEEYATYSETLLEAFKQLNAAKGGNNAATIAEARGRVQDDSSKLALIYEQELNAKNDVDLKAKLESRLAELNT